MKVWHWILIGVAVILVVWIVYVRSNITVDYPSYKYVVPLDSSCDFPTPGECRINDCEWRLLTDVVSPRMPYTCCPVGSEPMGIYSGDDPCSWGPFG